MKRTPDFTPSKWWITVSLLLAFTLVVPSGLSAAAKKEGLVPDENRRQKAEYFFLEALSARSRGEITASFEMFRHAIHIDSTLSAAHFELSVYYSNMKMPDEALQTLARSVRLSPSNYWYKMVLAATYEGYSLVPAAAAVYNSLRKEYPYKVEVLEMFAAMYIDADSCRNAIDVLNDLEQLQGPTEQTRVEKFKLYSKLNESDSAFTEIQRLVSQFPMNAQYRITQGDLYLDAGKSDEAYEYYAKGLELDPDNAYLCVSLSRYYEKLNKPVEAKRQIEVALVNDNLDVATKVRVLSTYLKDYYDKTGDFEPAFNLFKTLLDQHPQEAELFSLYGSFLISLKMYDEAIENYRVALALNPNVFDLWVEVIQSCFGGGKFVEALGFVSQAVEYFPERAELYYLRGIAFFQDEKYTDAINAYKHAATLSPEKNGKLSSDIYNQIGDTYHKLDKMDSCYWAYDQSLEYNPNNIVVMNNYAYFLSLEKKDLSKAERMSGKSIELDPKNSTYLDTYGWIFFMQGKYSLAKFYLEQAVSNATQEESTILEHYGDVLFMTDEPEEALKYWKKAMELGTDSKTLKNKIRTKTYIEE